jgi:hypothetical protein
MCSAKAAICENCAPRKYTSSAYIKFLAIGNGQLPRIQWELEGSSDQSGPPENGLRRGARESVRTEAGGYVAGIIASHVNIACCARHVSGPVQAAEPSREVPGLAEWVQEPGCKILLAMAAEYQALAGAFK